MEVAQFLQFLYSGMTVGSAYALAALGFIAWTALRRAFGKDRLPRPPSSE